MIENSLKSLQAKLVYKDKLNTEEAVKTALVLPLINMLGYNVFDPTEVIPEFDADVGTKKGEKVDYCIMKDGSPCMLIECKSVSDNLLNKKYFTQLYRYFSVTKARIAILTNGIVYKFYSDIDKTNIMDEHPFFELDLERIKDGDVTQLTKYHKDHYDEDNLLSNAVDLKYMRAIVSLLDSELKEPSDEFTKHFTQVVYKGGRITSNVLNDFKMIVKNAAKEVINKRLHTRLQFAEDKELDEIESKKEAESKINTTTEELEAYQLIKAMLRRYVDAERITYRDAQSYFSVLLDDNNRKPICRLWLEGKNWYIGIFDEQKNILKENLNTLDDIYQYEQKLAQVISNYE